MSNTLREVLGRRPKNHYRDWCVRTADGAPDGSPRTAQGRFDAGGVFNVHSTPSFKLKPGATVYTIGSCFARNVEAELSRLGFHLPALDLEVPEGLYTGAPEYPNTVLNKYSAHSTSAEILRAVGWIDDKDGASLMQVGDKWYDPHASAVGLMDRETALDLRRRMDAVTSHLLESDVLVLTLGLTEAWRDKETGAVLNVLHPALQRECQDRLQFFNATPDECFGELSAALDALRQTRPDMRVVLTVSPVPFRRTYTSLDVVSANTYSKAVLRATAGMAAERFKGFVDYYPSYEMVVNSPRKAAWLSDYIHVRPSAVAAVIGEFARRYGALGETPAA